MPRNPNNTNEFIAGPLPTITYLNKKYFVDGRMKQIRQTEDFTNILPDNDETWSRLTRKDKEIICFEFYGA